MVKIITKQEPSRKQENLMRIGAVVIALIASGIVLAVMGFNPFSVFTKIVEGSVFSVYRFQETINKTIPLVVLSLGIAIAFKMKFWNIGAEGQLYMGAFGASLIVFNCGSLPAIILLPLMLITAFIFGGLYALIPAFLKLKFKTSESLVTLMLNYVAVQWITYLQYGPWKDPKVNGFPKIPIFPDNAILPKVFGVHIGWIIALVLVVLMTVLFRKTKLGYEIDVLGESSVTAQYAGMNIIKITIISIMISGGLCGIAGMMQASGIETSLSNQLSGGLGFTAVITTWLARLSPSFIVVVSFLFAMLLQGSTYLQSSLGIPSDVGNILQGIIIFFVLGSEFFIRYRFVISKKKTIKEAA